MEYESSRRWLMCYEVDLRVSARISPAASGEISSAADGLIVECENA